MTDKMLPDIDQVQDPIQGAIEWEQWRRITDEVHQLRLLGQWIAATAESLHRYQVHVAYLCWSNDLTVKLDETEKQAKRVLTIIESLRKFTR